MIFYKSINKKQEFVDFIGEYTEWSDIQMLDNSCVAIYNKDTMRIGMNITIEQQNEKGFVSVKHIKDTMERMEKDVNKIIDDIEERGFVRDLLEKHGATISEVRELIYCLSTGKRFGRKLSNAANLVNENQEKYTGNWFIFLNIDASLL